MADPRAYFSVLGALDYMIPDVAEPVVRQILTAKAEVEGGAGPVVLDAHHTPQGWVVETAAKRK